MFSKQPRLITLEDFIRELEEGSSSTRDSFVNNKDKHTSKKEKYSFRNNISSKRYHYGYLDLKSLEDNSPLCSNTNCHSDTSSEKLNSIKENSFVDINKEEKKKDSFSKNNPSKDINKYLIKKEDILWL